MRKKSVKPQAKVIPLNTSAYTPINPAGEPLTIEKLRQFPGHEHLTDSQLFDLLYSIKAFARLLLKYAAYQENQASELNENSAANAA